MKAKIISDLHQEFGISDLDFSNADIVILAGDTNLGTMARGKPGRIYWL